MNEIIRVLFSLSVSGSILLLVILGLSKLMKERFSKAWLYYIWLIVILRLLIPVTPSVSPVGTLFNAIPPTTKYASTR
jgi:beta-lactamase regulating signal transducer with metallopeptidase domain